MENYDSMGTGKGWDCYIANLPFSVKKLLDQRNHFESKGGYCSQSVQQIVMQRDFLVPY